MADDVATSDLPCAVCGDAMTSVMSAECNWCDRRYHLNQRNDVPETKDCGQVWIDEQFLALQFACNDCLANDGPKSISPAAADAVPAARPARRRYRKRA